MSLPAAPASRPEPHRPALAITMVALGYALQINNGFYTPAAIALVGLSLALAWAALLAPGALGRLVPDADGLVAGLLAAGLAGQLVLLMTSPFAMYVERPLPRDHAGFVPLLMVAAVGGAVAVLGRRRWRAAALALLIAAHLGLGLLTFRASPDPTIDVVTVHDAAFKALAHGHSPYSIVFPDIYKGQQDFYPPGAVRDGIVHFGYTYLPVSLLSAWPGERLFGDFRVAELIGLAAGAGLLAMAGRLSTVAVLAAALLLFTPRVFFELEQAWNEPLMFAWLALGLWAWRARLMRLAVAGLGLAVGVKQYFAIGVPLAWLMPLPDGWLPGWPAWARRLRAPVLIGAVVAATIVPVLLWDADGFLKSAVLVQVNEKLRADALSFAVTYAHAYGHELSTAAYGAIVAAALALAAWRAPATPAGFAAASAVVLFTAFAFGKKAFCNYYFFVLCLVCAAIACHERETK